MTSWRRAVLAAAGVVLLSSGCTSFADTVADRRTADAAAETPAPLCPADRAAPDPDRPVIGLDFRLEDDLRTVTGTQSVAFTPDRPTGELVFRLLPNTPESAAEGNRLVVDDVRGRDVVSGGYESAGAADPGGLYVVVLDDEVAAGESTEVELDFTISLGTAAFDRLGTDAGVSWWGSGAPLLAWEPGIGWARDPFVDVSGETATSPVADVTLRVSAPEALTVLMTGDQDPPSTASGGRRTWTSAEPVARDVSVAAGNFTTTERTTPGGVRVTAGVLPDPDVPADQLADWTLQAIADLERRLGPFPYRTLTVPLLPDYGGGIEYPSSILMATSTRFVLVHEVAHMWFYGMVGNSQFRDPWLDEAFATYAEETTDPPPADRLAERLGRAGDVGDSMADFADDGSSVYRAVVYGKGGAALHAARDAVGREAFDAAVRCYVDANAWTIATPADLGAVLADLPDAVAVLAGAGMLDTDDVPR
ncbi:peptidase M1 [Blastococcus sp. CT_GayMR19]|uniref:M1 family aminopeptidase n=1 Tax=Blastococcus sp. CT_GayMR19 TaxID=2559608 RepID=UPI0010731933|nr:M1 family aminopeptidase [Blastococcus sp. CT_GayMR19]TFV76918.1 peptidase M1 [Blastococcus sp. CT_GayMR19]